MSTKAETKETDEAKQARARIVSGEHAVTAKPFCPWISSIELTPEQITADDDKGTVLVTMRKTRPQLDRTRDRTRDHTLEFFWVDGSYQNNFLELVVGM